MAPARGSGWARRGARGTTLIEVLFYMGMLSMLLAAVYSVLFSSVRGFLISATDTELEQSALSTSAWFSRELIEASPSSFSPSLPGTSPRGVVFASPRDDRNRLQYDDAGNLLWQRFVCYYIRIVDGVPCLVRSEEVLAAPQPAPPALGQRTTAWFAARPLFRIIGSHVTDFQTTATNPVAIQVTCERSALGQAFRLQFQTRLSLRN